MIEQKQNSKILEINPDIDHVFEVVIRFRVNGINDLFEELSECFKEIRNLLQCYGTRDFNVQIKFLSEEDKINV